MATKKKRRAPADVAARALVKMPLGELTRFADRLAKADEEVARYLLRLLAEVLTDAHPAGDAPDES